jgi:hypothetical protein
VKEIEPRACCRGAPRSTSFPVASRIAEPLAIALGPEGNIRLAEVGGIGRITPSRVAAMFSAALDAGVVSPGETAVGVDANLRFAESAGNKIGRLDLPLTAADTTVDAMEGHKHLLMP